MCSNSAKLLIVRRGSGTCLKWKIHSITLKNKRELLYVINVYAPTDKRAQIDFLDLLSKKVISLTDTSNLIIAGDWDTKLNAVDKQGGLS